MSKELDAIIEIDRLKEKYHFSAHQVFILQILKSCELAGLGYSSMLAYFIDNTKGDSQ